MTIPSVTVPPTPPTTADPDTFDTRADAFLPALVTLAGEFNTSVVEINATAATIDGQATAASASQIAAAASAATASAAASSAINAPGTSATSSTSLAVGTGSKSLTITTGKEFALGQFVTITSTASPSNWMHGNITAHNSGTGAMTVEVGTVGGSGTIASWTVALSGPSASGTSLPLAGGTMTGKVTLLTSATGGAGITFGSGVAPSAPADGDMWITTSAVQARVNGTTQTLAKSTDLAGYQPLDATLTALAGVTTSADKLIYASGSDTFTTATLTSFARTLLDDTTQGAMQTTLGLTPGTNVQAYSSELAALAVLGGAAYGRSLITLASASSLLGQIITASSLTANGYLKLSNGLYIMWGSFTASAAGDTTFSYTTIDAGISLATFSVATGSGGLDNNVNLQENGPRITGCTTTGFTVSNDESSSSTFFFIVVGA